MSYRQTVDRVRHFAAASLSLLITVRAYYAAVGVLSIYDMFAHNVPAYI